MLIKILLKVRATFRTKLYHSIPNKFSHAGSTIQLPSTINFGQIAAERIQGIWLKNGYILESNSQINTAGVVTANYKNRVQFLPVVEFLKSFTLSVNSLKPETHNEHLAYVPPQMWSTNFYHWSVEILPAIWFVYKHTSWPIVLPKMSNGNWNTLDFLLPQYDANRFIPTDKAGQFNSFIIISNIRQIRTAAVSLPNPTLLACYRQNKIENTPNLDILIISRRFSGNRIIQNEDVMLNRLKKIGLKAAVLYPEKSTFQEQVNMLSNTTIIIGPHGAGLTNMVHAPNLVKLVEITGKTGINGSFSSLAEALNIEYTHFETGYAKRNFNLLQYLSKTRRNYLLQESQLQKLTDIIEQQVNQATILRQPTP